MTESAAHDQDRCLGCLGRAGTLTYSADLTPEEVVHQGYAGVALSLDGPPFGAGEPTFSGVNPGQGVDGRMPEHVEAR